MGNYGFKITRDGYAPTETEERNYVFWSKHPTLKIYLQGSGTATIPSGAPGTVSVDIAHGLSFIPMYLLYSQLKDGSGKWFLNRAVMAAGDTDAGDQFVRGGTSGFPAVEAGLYVDATNLHIEYGTNDTTVSHDIDYYYYIFGNKGSI